LKLNSNKAKNPANANNFQMGESIASMSSTSNFNQADRDQIQEGDND